jgi:hypothetical protein
MQESRIARLSRDLADGDRFNFCQGLNGEIHQSLFSSFSPSADEADRLMEYNYVIFYADQPRAKSHNGSEPCNWQWRRLHERERADELDEWRRLKKLLLNKF